MQATKADLDERFAKQNEEVSAQLQSLKEEVARLENDNKMLRRDLSQLAAELQKLVDLVEPARAFLSRSDPAGDIGRLEKGIRTLEQAHKAAQHLQRMILHLLQGDYARALHETALEYYAAFPQYLARLCDASLAEEDRRADVLTAARGWARATQEASDRLRAWVVEQEEQWNSQPSFQKQQDQKVYYIMEYVRDHDQLRFYFKSCGVEPWALMLWSAARRIIEKPFADVRHDATHVKPGVQTAVAMFGPFLDGFGRAAPTQDGDLLSLIQRLAVIEVTPIGGESRLAFASGGGLQTKEEAELTQEIRDVFFGAYQYWL